MTVAHDSTRQALVGMQGSVGLSWASVALALAALDERLARDRAVDEGPAGAFLEAVTREPSLSNETKRLVADRARLTERVRRLRLYVAQVAGDPRQVPPVTEELAALAAAEDRCRRRSRAVFWDSFTRDIGGE